MSRLLLIVLIIALAGCGASEATAPTQTTVPTLAPTMTKVPATATVAPSATSAPTASPAPPTATVAPTASPAPPTANPTELALAHGPIAPTAAPTAAGALAAPSDPVRLVIEAIGIDRSLIAVGLDSNRIPIVPNHDVGWYLYSARPGQGENIVLWGHVLRFRNTPNIPAPFARLNELDVGAFITLYSADGSTRRYTVREKVWATPDQIEYVLPKGRELLTLVSCIGDKVIIEGSVEMTHRLITIAEPAGP